MFWLNCLPIALASCGWLIYYWASQNLILAIYFTQWLGSRDNGGASQGTPQVPDSGSPQSRTEEARREKSKEQQQGARGSPGAPKPRPSRGGHRPLGVPWSSSRHPRTRPPSTPRSQKPLLPPALASSKETGPGSPRFEAAPDAAAMI